MAILADFGQRQLSIFFGTLCSVYVPALPEYVPCKEPE